MLFVERKLFVKYKILDANAVEVYDVDYKNLSPDDVSQIADLYFKHLVVISRNQHLTPEDMIKVANQFGIPEYFDPETQRQRAAENVNGVQRVCKGFNPDGTPAGLFGHDEELNWHANRPSAENERKPIIFLAAAHDTNGSKISWANMALAYEDLTQQTKDFLENKKGIYGFEPNTYTKSFNIWKSHRNKEGQDFIRVNPAGIKGMFFPYFQFFGFKDVDEETSNYYKELLFKHCYQDKYCYHHEYEDGDIIFGDQWLTVHKRWACDLGNRMIYRVSMDWSKVI